jgi:hypothetical protein
LALFIPEIEQNRRKSFWAKQKRLRIELPDPIASVRAQLALARAAAFQEPEPSIIFRKD